MKFRHAVRLGAVTAVATVTAVFGVAWSASAATAATTTVNGFNAQAYGTFLSGFGGTVRSGPTAFTQLGCTTKTGIATHNATTAVTVPGVGSIGAVTAATSTAAVTGGVRDDASATIGQTSLLGGLVAASAIHARAATKDIAGVRAAGGTASLVSLKVAGRAVTATPNLTVKLTAPGAKTPFATAVFNEQTVSRTATRISVTERAIDIAVTAANPLKLPIGSRIVIGDAQATLAPGVQGLLGGNGYGTTATLGSTVRSGPTAWLAQSCFGSTGTNRIASQSTVLLHTGAVVTHIVGSIGTSAADTRTTNQITTLNLLAGTVTADSITAATHARATGGHVALDATGSGFTHLQVLGKTINANTVKPNTTITLPGLGTLTLRKTDTTTTGGLHKIAVTMVALTILHGPQTGTTLTAATASASIRR
jgi:hypothetical protein